MKQRTLRMGTLASVFAILLAFGGYVSTAVAQDGNEVKQIEPWALNMKCKDVRRCNLIVNCTVEGQECDTCTSTAKHRQCRSEPEWKCRPIANEPQGCGNFVNGQCTKVGDVFICIQQVIDEQHCQRAMCESSQ